MANAVSKIDDQYFQLVTAEGSDEATIFLYDIIGPTYEYDYEKEKMKKGGTTDIDFVRTLTALAEKKSRINVRINSPGGSVLHGHAICAAIKNCKAEIHTYNDGTCASMAAQIWFAAKNRHMAKNAMMMTHAPSISLLGNAKNLRDAAAVLDKMTESAAIHIADMTGKTPDEAKARFFKEDKNEWFSFNDCQTEKLISGSDDYESEKVIENASQLSLDEIIQIFQKNHAAEPPKPSVGLLAQLHQFFSQAKNAPVQEEKIPAAAPMNPPAIHAQTTAEMTKADFHQALEDGTLGVAEVAKALEQKGFGVTAPVDPVAAAQQAGSDEFFKKFEAKEAALNAKIDALTQKLEAIAAAPGAARSTPDAPENDPGGIDPVMAEVAEYNAKMNAMAAEGRSPFASR